MELNGPSWMLKVGFPKVRVWGGVTGCSGRGSVGSEECVRGGPARSRRNPLFVLSSVAEELIPGAYS